jgi:hypothetical protein
MGLVVVCFARGIADEQKRFARGPAHLANGLQCRSGHSMLCPYETNFVIYL